MTRKNGRKYWAIKTTEGGPGYPDHWEHFKDEGVVAIGWGYDDPSKFSSLSKYSRYCGEKTINHAIRTIWKFYDEWKKGDVAIVCIGYPPNQKKDVHLYGIAEVGDYSFDRKSWFKFKREAKIWPIEVDIPLNIFSGVFGGSLWGTINGPFTEDQFRKFSKKIEMLNPELWHRAPRKFRSKNLKRQYSVSRRTAALEKIVQQDLNSMQAEENFKEGGGKKRRYINYYERNPKLRAAAIEHHRTKCKICGFDFGKFYGERGVNYIEVHHLRPVSSRQDEAKVNFKTDMTTVCSNCHRMIHRKKGEILSPEDMKKLIKKNKRRCT